MKVRYVPAYSWIKTAEGWRQIYHRSERCLVDDRGPLALAPFQALMSDGGPANADRGEFE